MPSFGFSTKNSPDFSVPCLKCIKKPVLELPAPLPSSLNRNAGLFPGNGGSSNEGMSDEEFNDLLKELGESPMGGDKDETPTGGNSMSVGNLPDNMEGEPSEDNSPSTNSVQLTDKQKDLLKKKIEKQKKFMDGDIQKTTITKTDSKNLNAIEESGSEMKEGECKECGYKGDKEVMESGLKKLEKISNKEIEDLLGDIDSDLKKSHSKKRKHNNRSRSI